MINGSEVRLNLGNLFNYYFRSLHRYILNIILNGISANQLFE